MKKTILLPTLLTSMTLVLTACGGGNSDSGARPADTEPPVITMNGGNIEIDQHSTYTDANATATDNVDESVDVITFSNVDTATAGSYTVTYSAVDAAGNAATDVVRIVTVKDTTAPVITMNGGNIEIDQAGTYIDAGATATDNVDASITVTSVTTVDTTTVGSYTVTYSATDAAGNKALDVVRKVTVKDITAPVITVLGGPAKTEQGLNYYDLGANALDAVDGIVPVNTNSIDTTEAGIKTVRYTAVDTAGNSATAERTVKVIRPTSFNEFDGTWRSQCLGDPSLPAPAQSVKQEFVLSNGVLNNKLKVYTTDDCTGVVSTIDVDADVEFSGKVQTLTGQNGGWLAERVDSIVTKITVNGVEKAPADLTTFLNDNNYPVFNIFALNQNGKLMTGKLRSGNGTTEALRPTELALRQAAKYTKVDLIVPNITMIGHNNITIPVGTTYFDAGATAYDNQDGDITSSITTTDGTNGPVNTAVPDTYTITYSVSDVEGNNTTATRTVNVIRVANTFTTFDGTWNGSCIRNTNPVLSSLGIRAIKQKYVIANDQNTTTVEGFTSTNCAGSPDRVGTTSVDIIYRGEVDVDASSCASGKAEKVDLTVISATKRNGDPLTDDELKALQQATSFPTHNLLCIDTNNELREGDVGGDFNGLTESKRPIEMDMTGAGLVKQL